MKFSCLDYYRMFRFGGVRLVYNYFRNNHLFDLIHKVDTHSRILKKDFKEIPSNFCHGVLYMSSWDVVIKESSEYVLEKFGGQDLSFIDIGCGKGKVLLYWLLKIKAIRGPVIGVEYSLDIADICKKNLTTICGAGRSQVLNVDVTKICLLRTAARNVFYLYNPFDGVILRKFIENSCLVGDVVIYNNPVNIDVFDEGHWKLNMRKQGFHPNMDFVVLEKVS